MFTTKSMPQVKHLTDRIFSIKDDKEFNGLALEIFQYQLKNNKVYHDFVNNLSVNTDAIIRYHQIPFLPIELFNDHAIKTGDFKPEINFSSSGTTGTSVSRHYVKDIKLYRKSFLKTFQLFFGNPDQYTILALLPSYLEREGSSLIFMVNELIERSNKPESGFFLHNQRDLSILLRSLKSKNEKVILFGVSFALVDFATDYQMDFPGLIIIETGGMKGRRKEMVRTELHSILKKGFGVKQIYSEYGMTELLSQAYSVMGGKYSTPSWMKVLIRDMNDPLSLLSRGKTGGINVIDLANIHSCSFIATQDLGSLDKDGKFEVLGRFDNSDARGCNLMVV
jgi:hypothetical protein